MALSSSYFGMWTVMRRSIGSTRLIVNLWLFAMLWVFQVFAVVVEGKLLIGPLYPFAVLHSAAFMSLMVSLLERLGLPRGLPISQEPCDTNHVREPAACNDTGREDDDEEVTADGEVTGRGGPSVMRPLLGTYRGPGWLHGENPMALGCRKVASSVVVLASMVLEWLQQPFKEGDPWSTYVPIWTWLLQLLILAPVTLTVVGGQGLADVSAIAMTGVDGSSLATPFVVIGVLSIVVFLPFTPFIHRATHHVPVLALLVFVGASVYNFTAFPFSTSNRFKFIFKQTVDLDKGRNVVTLSGIEEYLYQVIDSIPEAGRQLESTKCQPTVERPLTDCLYDASLYAPQLVSGVDLEDMMTVNMSKSTNGTTVHIHLDALETRGCWLDLSRPISSFAIEGEAERDPRLGENPPDGLIQHIQVWRRGWAGAWKVSLQLAEDESSSATWGIREGESDDGMSPGELRQRTECNMDYLGRPLEVTVRCAWGDANEPGTIPALRRVEQYMPPWAIATRRGFGLVEMQKTYKAA